MRVVDAAGQRLIEQTVETGDIFRACQTKDEAIKRLGQARRQPRPRRGAPGGVLAGRSARHDAELDREGRAYLPEHDTAG
jgi:isocitrate dehydrogenase